MRNITGISLRRFADALLAVATIMLVGVLSTEQARAQACPDWSLQGSQLSYGSDQLWTPQSVGVTAGGNVNLGNCPNVPGHGYIIQGPDFDLDFFENNAGRDLEFRVQGSCDTVLLVNDASGNWHFNDDSSGVDPRIRVSRAPAGAYDIWVGTYGPSTCSSTLVMETFGGSSSGGGSSGGGSSSAGTCPDWSLSGTSVSYGSDQLWTPRQLSVTAGGGIDLSQCGSVPGHGYIIQGPDFELNFTENNANRALEFRVQGSCDTVLLVNDANANWHFNDDADGTVNPRIRLPQARSGVYDIWVGTYGNSTCSATLTLETF